MGNDDAGSRTRLMPSRLRSASRGRPFAHRKNFVFWVGVFAICAGFLNARADEVDDIITVRMRERDIVGVSLAIVEDGKIIKAKGYGFTDKSGHTPVTPATLFQAGSVSKSVAGFGALQLVEQGKLSLDSDVNTQLHTWKLPETEYTKDKKVTLRRILCHSAGLTVHGFPGYARNVPIPTLVEVLDGVKPANTPAIRADIVPGSRFRYTGGVYTLMQQMMIDATGKPFPEFMRDSVLKPLGMTNSTYEQPLPEKMEPSSAAGYYATGKPVGGRWHIYPEMAAAGLWTTPTDLARFVVGIQQAFSGSSHSLLSQSMARQMLVNQYPSLSKDDGLGVFLGGSGETLQFSHGGRDAGFDPFMIGYAKAGKGAVIMMNANDDRGTIKDIVRAIAKEYAWKAFDANSVN